MRIVTKWLPVSVGIACLACACTSLGPTPEPSATTPQTTPTEVVLSGQGAAGYPFGSEAGDVEPTLRSSLGAPSQVIENAGCPLNPIWTKMMRWQGLTVTFEGDTATRTSRTGLSSWQLRPDQGVPVGVTLADDLPLTPTFAELTAQHPSTSLKQQLGWYLMELPEGITYIGEDRASPSTIQGGPLRWCE